METNNRLVGLPLFQIPQGDDVEEGILLSAFLCEWGVSVRTEVLPQCVEVRSSGLCDQPVGLP